MKIYVSVDMEGISGVFSWEQTGRDEKGSEYEKARHLYTQDANAVVEACKENGVERIVVMDGHNGGYNFVIEELHPDGEYIIGHSRRDILPGFDKSFDGVILLGFHAMAGTLCGILDHTQSSKTWFNYFINGKKMGEVGQEAVMAGGLGVPIILVTGDKAVCKEAKQLLGNVETVAVKEGLSRNCARIIAPVKAHQLIREGAKRAIKRIKDFKPYIIKPPIEVRIEFQNTDVADGYERAGWKRVDGRTVCRTVDSALKIVD
ncbi:MAG: aminopeptidase [bacterium (Candidatus Ratteibacteria) CG_4_10_14_3_um_filter_41_18]|uniref:Aminopeptidase n=4 Tax=Candidatus Ratteibacteria TaxID=2979319 RepID=A0A2M7YI41_9BACT|nr:MAG: hypothetical protein AUJ76_01620 [Candidatus Omnitrophica bacterium CG1_02_41_171]PIV63672.1 MAG: aminopeptidase [bacterium (Candidatus Ratteibacteria) CG01_land_8_20_14_3_00_40_19]PIW31618.1 MAG: aminopeptidase [bacterium (Candidatus Ratteibacteria) CG15_BIG_FIL_POST_REV_8_21_14_020_41_12]PIW74222.1 MAG: aminopeptidase [bacterium (Candidatus Ratteibacteria) CG_4_8_14_3_um_filter_41_36]PIX77167.1 MAG: aminopeptidase [bacterium (Candidatus Ratteibacteria) CG_4_10_14_3_um_filter_41_18]PJ